MICFSVLCLLNLCAGTSPTPSLTMPYSILFAVIPVVFPSFLSNPEEPAFNNFLHVAQFGDMFGSLSSDGNGGESESGSATEGSGSATEKSGSATEGCVDSSILPTSCRRIHSEDVMADVLCFSGLCATPNHQIFVDGGLTSLKRVCGGRQSRKCSVTRMAVNNCYHRDVLAFELASGIVVTPYDDRFPHWLTRIVQDLVIASRALYSGYWTFLASFEVATVEL